MTKTEIQEKIRELDSCINDSESRVGTTKQNVIGLIVIDIIADILFWIAIACFITSDSVFITLGVILMIISVALCITLPFWIVGIVKAAKAPRNIRVYTERKEQLQKELDEYDTKKVNNSTNVKTIEKNDVQTLIDLKKLLDSNVIFEEEYDKKKKEILNRM